MKTIIVLLLVVIAVAGIVLAVTVVSDSSNHQTAIRVRCTEAEKTILDKLREYARDGKVTKADLKMAEDRAPREIETCVAAAQ